MVMSIFICESNFKQRQQTEAVVREYFSIENGNIQLVLSTDSPKKLVEYVKMHRLVRKNNLYILDADMEYEMDGFALAETIRNMDIFGKIIFVANDQSKQHLVFRHRVEALDYICKDDPFNMESSLKQSIAIAYKRYLDSSPQKQYCEIKTKNSVISVAIDDILFFESHRTIAHKRILYTLNGQIEFYGSLHKIEKMRPEFYRSHKSFVINVENVTDVSRVTNEVYMANGAVALVARKKIKGLLDML